MGAAEGPAATVIDLYELAARPRGLTARELTSAERRALARCALPDVWHGFATTDNSSRIGDLIEIADYDPAWPARFAQWHDAIRSALGQAAKSVIDV